MESSLVTPTNESKSLPTGKRIAGFKELLHRVGQEATERTKAVDNVVRIHPYQTIGLALGVGLLIGVLAGRKWKA
jgi:ElaB/YqjD/DUF883 family membrane-anchored ribosome-binding protein